MYARTALPRLRGRVGRRVEAHRPGRQLIKPAAASADRGVADRPAQAVAVDGDTPGSEDLMLITDCRRADLFRVATLADDTSTKVISRRRST